MSTAQLPQVQAHDYSELGPIAQLVTNPQVTEIMVMGARDIYCAPTSMTRATSTSRSGARSC